MTDFLASPQWAEVIDKIHACAYRIVRPPEREDAAAEAVSVLMVYLWEDRHVDSWPGLASSIVRSLARRLRSRLEFASMSPDEILAPVVEESAVRVVAAALPGRARDGGPAVPLRGAAARVRRRDVDRSNLAIVPKGKDFAPEHVVANFTAHGVAFQSAPGGALRVPAGSLIALQLYYTAIGRAVLDRPQVGLRFPSHPVQQEVRVVSFGNAAFEVPAHAYAHRIEAAFTMPANAEAVSLFAHMHARGRDVTVFAEASDGTSTTLLAIPAYDFRGQETYLWRPGSRRLEGGTKIRAVAHFDNSVWNPANPDATQVVRRGLQVSDEQLQVVLAWREPLAGPAVRVDPATGARVVDSDSAAGK